MHLGMHPRAGGWWEGAWQLQPGCHSLDKMHVRTQKLLKTPHRGIELGTPLYTGWDHPSADRAPSAGEDPQAAGEPPPQTGPPSQ